MPEKANLDDREVHWAKTLNAFGPHGFNLRRGTGRGATPEAWKRPRRIAPGWTPEMREAAASNARAALEHGWTPERRAIARAIALEAAGKIP